MRVPTSPDATCSVVVPMPCGWNHRVDAFCLMGMLDAISGSVRRHSALGMVGSDDYERSA